jgi:hypothetical protein
MSQKHLASAALPVHTAQDERTCGARPNFRRDDGQGSSGAAGDIRVGERPQKPTLF